MQTLTPVKRVEIVIDFMHLRRLTQSVETAGVRAYTILPDASGRGDRGLRAADDVVSSDKNSLLLIAVSEEQLQPLLDSVRPLLARYGGLCLVSDAGMLPH